jgi:hypothetical protein
VPALRAALPETENQKAKGKNQKSKMKRSGVGILDCCLLPLAFCLPGDAPSRFRPMREAW